MNRTLFFFVCLLSFNQAHAKEQTRIEKGLSIVHNDASNRLKGLHFLDTGEISYDLLHWSYDDSVTGITRFWRTIKSDDILSKDKGFLYEVLLKKEDGKMTFIDGDEFNPRVVVFENGIFKSATTCTGRDYVNGKKIETLNKCITVNRSLCNLIMKKGHTTNYKDLIKTELSSNEPDVTPDLFKELKSGELLARDELRKLMGFDEALPPQDPEVFRKKFKDTWFKINDKSDLAGTPYHPKGLEVFIDELQTQGIHALSFDLDSTDADKKQLESNIAGKVFAHEKMEDYLQRAGGFCHSLSPIYPFKDVNPELRPKEFSNAPKGITVVPSKTGAKKAW